MNTGLVTKENEFIPIPYYEIGVFAENICNQYVLESEEHKIKFELFSKDYSFFKPYLDFLLFELGYKMVNPLLYENSIWSVENDRLLLKSFNRDKSYVPISDISLDIGYINPESLDACMIDQDGKTYKVDRNMNICHENVCDLIINQYLIYDKELFNIYKEYMGKGADITGFARNILGFVQMDIFDDKTGTAIYCDNFYNSFLDNIFKRIKELNPDFNILPYSVHSKESLEIANQCIERVSKENENRRLRF